jgi:Asp-tRNA(Asn)/Glu-tRNA(Gln) amidotransferase A subunit family amidase
MPVCAARSGTMSPLITRTESNILLRKTRQRCVPFLPSRINVLAWFHSRASAACIIDRIGKMPKERREVMRQTYRTAEQEYGNRGTSGLLRRQFLKLTGTRIVADFLTKYDVILTPTLGAPPPQLGYFDTVNTPFEELLKCQFDHIPFTWLHNVTGLPAMSVPLFWNREGLPIGVQFAGRYADEATLYRIAGQLEEARPWKGRIPSIAL